MLGLHSHYCMCLPWGPFLREADPERNSGNFFNIKWQWDPAHCYGDTGAVALSREIFPDNESHDGPGQISAIIGQVFLGKFILWNVLKPHSAQVLTRSWRRIEYWWIDVINSQCRCQTMAPWLLMWAVSVQYQGLAGYTAYGVNSWVELAL